MQKRVFLIHGWDSHKDAKCFPWLKKELEGQGYRVEALSMPTPLEPKIDTWVPFLADKIGTPNENTFLLGHSIGAQTVLRYLEQLKEDEKIGGAVLLAGWLHLTDETFEDEEDKEIAKPWLETPIDWGKVRSHTDKFTAIFSDDDPFVPFSDSTIFADKLGAEIITEHGKGHFSDDNEVKELPSALSAIREIAE
ncbi:MAG: alpha/beta hydrolase [Patescibacteria group bacterium]|nr:alpha/beta hydrolase [Patescibacteria group bacterium]